MVGFDKGKRQELKSFCDYSAPRNCLVQQNKFKNTLEVVLKSQTKTEPSETQFDVPDLKTVGSSFVTLNNINELP